MTKKVLLLLILMAFVAGGAFAQLAVEGGVSMIGNDFFTSFGDINLLGLQPTVGVVFSLSSFDVLAGLSFSISTYNEVDNGPPKQEISYNTNSLGIYAGIALRMLETEKWSLSLPLLARVSFGGKSEDKATPALSTGWPNIDAGYSFFEIGLRAGAKAEYAFSNQWSLFTGILIDVVSWNQTEVRDWKGSTTADGVEKIGTIDNLSVFNSGVIQLGIKYRF